MLKKGMQIMNKKLVKFLCLALASSLVAGCDTTKTSSSSSSTETPVSAEAPVSNNYENSEANISTSSATPATSKSSSTPSSSSSSTTVGETWDAATKALMQTYAGEVLPYVALEEGFVASESEDSNGDKYLEMYDYSESFTIPSRS